MRDIMIYNFCWGLIILNICIGVFRYHIENNSKSIVATVLAYLILSGGIFLILTGIVWLFALIIGGTVSIPLVTILTTVLTACYWLRGESK